MIPQNSQADIEHRFKHHVPDDDRASRHAMVRSLLRDVAHEVTILVPPGREQALALTKIEEAMMWANAGIARERK